jgi:hypothetical protein
MYYAKKKKPPQAAFSFCLAVELPIGSAVKF